MVAAKASLAEFLSTVGSNPPARNDLTQPGINHSIPNRLGHLQLRGRPMAVSKSLRPCKTMEEFIAQWDKKLNKIIASYGLLEFTDDIKQDIFLDMCTPEDNPESANYGKTGLEAYDPNLGAFSTYVYGLVLMKVRNARAKYLRETRVMPFSNEAAESKSKDRGDNSNSIHPRDKLEMHGQEIEGVRSDMDRVEFKMQLNNILDALSTYPVRSFFFRDGECITRDLKTLFELILSGKTREEIIDHFQYSTGSVGVMFEQLRQVPELLELRDMITSSDY